MEVTHFIHSPTQFANYFRFSGDSHQIPTENNFFRFCGGEIAMISKQQKLTSDATVTQTFCCDFEHELKPLQCFHSAEMKFVGVE
jgi:hypothetical protein